MKKKVRILGGRAYLGGGEFARCFHVGNSGLHIIETTRSVAQQTTLGVRAVRHHLVDMLKILGRPHAK